MGERAGAHSYKLQYSGTGPAAVKKQITAVQRARAAASTSKKHQPAWQACTGNRNTSPFSTLSWPPRHHVRWPVEIFLSGASSIAPRDWSCALLAADLQRGWPGTSAFDVTGARDSLTGRAAGHRCLPARQQKPTIRSAHPSPGQHRDECRSYCTREAILTSFDGSTTAAKEVTLALRPGWEPITSLHVAGHAVLC